MFTDLVSNISRISDNLTLFAFLSPSIIAGGYLFGHLIDVFLNSDFYNNLINDDDLSLYNESLFCLKNHYGFFLNMNFQHFLLNFRQIDDFENYYNCVRNFVIHNKDENFNFFLSSMRPGRKQEYINLFNLILTDIDYKEFIEKKNAEEFFYLINKRIIKI